MTENKIHTPERIKQIVSFEGLDFKGSHPTDIDGLLEFNGKLFIFFEIKLKGTDLPKGQRIAYENIAIMLSQIANCVVIVSEHSCYDTKETIIAANTIVKEYWHQGGWIDNSGVEWTLKELINRIMKYYKL